MTTYKGISTWIEDWQGTEECNTPIAPFSDGSFNYTFQNGTLTTIGLGAHIGISKAYNGGEYDSTSLVFQDSVYYTISFLIIIILLTLILMLVEIGGDLFIPKPLLILLLLI